MPGDFPARRAKVVKLARAFRGPKEGLFRPRLAGCDLDTIGDHEGRIESNAELADQTWTVLGLRGREFLPEGLGAGTSDGAQIVDQFLPRHADPVVGDHQGARLFVGNDPNFGLGGRGEFRVGQRLKPAAVAGVGGIGDQLTQKDFSLGVERVDDEVQQAPHFSAKAVFFQYGIVHWTLPAGGRYAHVGWEIQYRWANELRGGVASIAARTLNADSSAKQANEVSYPPVASRSTPESNGPAACASTWPVRATPRMAP